MTKYKWSVEQVFYSVLAVALMAAFCHLALACYYADSEIWLLTLSQKTFSNPELSSIYYKWTFHALTYLFSQSAPTELDVYHNARMGWAIVAIISQWVVAYTFSQFANDKRLLLPFFISIFTFSAFFNQGFRIRGDILSLLSHSVILLTLFKLKDKEVRFQHYVWMFIWNVVLILSTPKSLYFYAAQFVFGISLYTFNKGSKSFFLFVWISHLLPAIGLLALALMTQATGFSINLMIPIQEATDYYLKSFDQELINTKFLSMLDFAHVIKIAARSYIHTLIFLIGTTIYFVTSYKTKKDSIFTSLNIYFGTLLLFVVFHNQKFPFFIGTFGTPLIAYSFLYFTLGLQKILKNKTKYALMLTLTFMVIVCNAEYQRNLKENNNFGQQVAIKIFDEYTSKHPDLRFYDIIGLLPRKTSIFLFVGPGEVSRKKQIIDDLNKIDPDIILFTFKFIYLEPEIREFLTETRISVEDNVWIKGDFFSVAKTMDYFRKAETIDGNKYWIIPHPPRNHIYDLPTRTSIKDKVLYLKNGLVMKHAQDADSFALPVAYLDVVQTNVEPIGFLQQPYMLFRYDTNF